MREQAEYTHLPILGGVDMLHATYVSHAFSRHFHEEYAVGCIMRGAMRFRYRGETLVAPAGQVNLVVPGEAHDGQGATDQGWTYRMFYLRPEALREAATCLRPDEGDVHFTMGVIDDPALARCVAATHMALSDPSTPALEKETRLYWLLAGWISRHAEIRTAWPAIGTEHRAVETARTAINDRFGEDISLGDLARAAGLSPFHLVRVFEARMGVTPHAYLTQVRTERARERLAGPTRLADVAADCGFADQPHLTRLFKRRFGVTPGNYRKMLQNN